MALLRKLTMSFFTSLFSTLRGDTPAPSTPPPPRKSGSIAGFRDEVGVTTRHLDFDLWLITHRRHFIITVVAFLSLIGVVTWGYSLYHWGEYLIVGQQQDENLRQALGAETTLYHDSGRTTGYLKVGEVEVMAHGPTEVDFIGSVMNTNLRGIITFDYYFDVNGQRVGAGQDFVLPGDSKYVLALAQPVSVQGNNAILVIENLSLKRLPPEIAQDWQYFREERLNFVISEAKFIPGQINGLSDKVSLGQISFNLTNAGAYGYKNARFIVLLKSGNRIVGATPYYLQNVRSGDNKTVSFTWYGAVPTVSQVEVIPDINPFDDSVYLKYSL